MEITSPAFQNNEEIPAKYTADGENVNPELNIKDIPPETKSLVLINDDPDAAKVCGHTWDHWIVFNIPANITQISENSMPGLGGMNSYQDVKYGGPNPPKGSGIHNYYFKIYALDIELELEERATKQEVEAGMKDHILAQAELIGRYTRD